MPRGRPRKTPDPLEDDFIPPPTQEEEDYDAFIEEMGPVTSSIEIYKMERDGSRPHMERVGIEVLREDVCGYLREEFGPGKYLLQFRGSDRKIKKSKVFSVGGKPDGVIKAERGGGSDSRFHQDLILALIASNKPAPPPAPIDIGSLLQGLAAMAPKGPDPTQTLTAIITAVTALKGNGDTLDIDKITKIVSLGKDLAGSGGDSDDSMLGIAKGVTKEIIGAFRGNGTGGGQRQIPERMENNSKGQNSDVQEVKALPAQVNEQSEDEALQQWIKAQLDFLKRKAKSIPPKEPEDWVNYILDNDDEPGCRSLLYALERGATFEHLLQFDPEIGQNPQLKDWFSKLYDGLQRELSTDMDTAGAGRDIPDASDDAKTGADAQPQGKTTRKGSQRA